jgi:hypothetical protein
MCSYYPRLPIRLDDFDITQNGLRLVMKRVKFIGDRTENEPEMYEA